MTAMEPRKPSRLIQVLQRAQAGDIVDKPAANAAILEYEGLLEEMKARPPAAREKGQGAWDDVETLRSIVKYQDKKIRDLTLRLRSPSPGGVKQKPGVTTGRDRDDTKLRHDLAADFNRIFDSDWRRAYKELRDHMLWTDVECLYTLMRVIRTVCEMCYNVASDQIDKLVVDMEETTINPTNGNTSRLKKMLHAGEMKYTEGMKVGEKYALEYRQQRAAASVPALVDMFMDTKLRFIIEPSYMRSDLRRYIEKCIKSIWLMSTLEPPMRVYWQKQAERVQLDFFHHHGRPGDCVNQTVWPALFIHNTGPLISRGHVLAI